MLLNVLKRTNGKLKRSFCTKDVQGKFFLTYFVYFRFIFCYISNKLQFIFMTENITQINIPRHKEIGKLSIHFEWDSWIFSGAFHSKGSKEYSLNIFIHYEIIGKFSHLVVDRSPVATGGLGWTTSQPTLTDEEDKEF